MFTCEGNVYSNSGHVGGSEEMRILPVPKPIPVCTVSPNRRGPSKYATPTRQMLTYKTIILNPKPLKPKPKYISIRTLGPLGESPILIIFGDLFLATHQGTLTCMTETLSGV